MDQVDSDLRSMVGLDRAKSQIESMVNSAALEQEKRANGMNVKPKNRNMLFVGPAGTGKTTVAEKIGPLFNALGITPTTNVKTITADELVSEYKGESAKQAKKVVNEAKGGVLFVDEAYALVSGKDDDYGKQALAAILPALEWDDTVVIFGGYKEELDQMLATNVGGRRRFPTTIEFEPFTQKQRAQILGNAMRDGGYRLEDKAVGQAMLDAVQFTGEGNGGDVMNLWGYIQDAQAGRLAGEEKGPDRAARLTMVTADDVHRGAEQYALRARPQNPIGTLVPTGRKRAA